MGDASTVLTAAEARHLLQRSGFGATPAAVAKIVSRGDTRGTAVDRILGFAPKKFQPGGKGKDPSLQESHDKWIAFMLKAKFPLQEKLVLFWHDHFATSNAKVGNVAQMAQQNLLLRLFCKGNFRDFVKAMNKNPAMITASTATTLAGPIQLDGPLVLSGAFAAPMQVTGKISGSGALMRPTSVVLSGDNDFPTDGCQHVSLSR